MEGMTPEEENVLLKAENVALREHAPWLVAQVQDLQARLAKDSHNSSKPPPPVTGWAARPRVCGAAAAKSVVGRSATAVKPWTW
jgi:hypothetical protein